MFGDTIHPSAGLLPQSRQMMGAGWSSGGAARGGWHHREFEGPVE